MITDTNFLIAEAFTLKAEGLYSNRAADHGGSTMMGITQAAYDEYTGGDVTTHPVTEITTDIAGDFYYNQVWLGSACDKMPCALAICHFDWATNHGDGGADKSLQTYLGVTVDGQIGPGTLAAITVKPLATVIQGYLDYRRNWYKNDVKNHPDQGTFLKGWLARVDRLQAYVAPYIK